MDRTQHARSSSLNFDFFAMTGADPAFPIAARAAWTWACSVGHHSGAASPLRRGGEFEPGQCRRAVGAHLPAFG